jgi:HEAT repeat protein
LFVRRVAVILGDEANPLVRPVRGFAMRRRRVVIGAAALAVAAAGVWLTRPKGPPEPVYRGKTLSAWLDERRDTGRGPVVLTDEAVAAVRAIGPRAIPTLLAWLRASDSQIIRGARDVLEWRLKLVRVPTNDETRMRAMYGFRALGPAARPAFPAIVALALHSPDDGQGYDAINALCESDADTLRSLAAGLNHPDREVRLRAVDALCALRFAPNNEVCLPALEGAAGTDPDPRVRAEAVRAIAFINQELKSLTYILTADPDPEIRATAARSVGLHGARARAFLPDLEAAAHDDDPKVCEAAAEAIRQVRGPERQGGAPEGPRAPGSGPLPVGPPGPL